MKTNATNLLKAENTSLKNEIQDARQREDTYRSNISQLEFMNCELLKRVSDSMSGTGEVKTLNALNRIAATACRYASVEEMLPPTLNVTVRALEEIWAPGKGGTDAELKISAGIFLLDEDGNALKLHAAAGISKDSLACAGAAMSGDCLCGIAAASKEIIFSPNCLSDVIEKDTHCHINKDRFADHSHISIPLIAAGKVTGVLFIYILPAGFEPKLSGLAALKSIGNYIGLQIENTMLNSKGATLATRDPVTGMYNGNEFKNLLDTELKRAARNSKEFSIMMLDIDGMRELSKRFKHKDGMKIVKTVGGIISNGLRTFDVAGRVENERFAVILPDTPVKNALTPAQRLRTRVEERRLSLKGAASNVTVSVGISSFPHDSNSLDGLIQSADKALSKAKEAGKNRVCFSKLDGSTGNC